MRTGSGCSAEPSPLGAGWAELKIPWPPEPGAEGGGGDGAEPTTRWERARRASSSCKQGEESGAALRSAAEGREQPGGRGWACTCLPGAVPAAVCRVGCAKIRCLWSIRSLSSVY